MAQQHRHIDTSSLVARTLGCVAAVLAVFLLVGLIIRYQRALHLRYGAWLTVVTIMSITGLAIASGVQNNYPKDFREEHISGRVLMIATWVVLEIILILIGVVMKVILPCAMRFTLLHAFRRLRFS